MSEELLRDLPQTLSAVVRHFGTDGKGPSVVARRISL